MDTTSRRALASEGSPTSPVSFLPLLRELDIKLVNISGGSPYLQHKRICRTFSDCTTAPRSGMPSGCYPLDQHYKQSRDGAQLKEIKAAARGVA